MYNNWNIEFIFININDRYELKRKKMNEKKYDPKNPFFDSKL